jgi:pyrroloquinoline quinone (PQQ) biosynthesis protein C
MMNLKGRDFMGQLRERLAPVREQLNNHPIYRDIATLKELRIFFESHVFAVWDFMSLLKALQQMLTCARAPWLPTHSPLCRRLVNEIVLAEESDDFEGTYLSHFEMYRQAMLEAGANVHPVDQLLEALSDGTDIATVLLQARIPEEAKRFVETTFSIIQQREPHVVAAAFTFGREDLIPDMFRSMVSGLNERFPGQLSTFLYYLARHIDVDGDSHGPMSLRMISELCGGEERRWDQAAEAAVLAMNARLAFWTAIHKRISLVRASVT